MLAILLLLLVVAGCGNDTGGRLVDADAIPTPEQIDAPESRPAAGTTKVATFGAGCFWCVEAVFEELKGVSAVTSGFMGGHVENPSYKQVCAETTGHAEVAQIAYDPSVISYKELLEVFWKTHDPTTLDRQGADVGARYRSAIFAHDDEQRAIAEQYKQKLDEAGAYDAPIVTEVTDASTFWPAEDYHQEYLANNPGNPYCRAVVQPKVDKFRKAFADKLK